MPLPTMMTVSRGAEEELSLELSALEDMFKPDLFLFNLGIAPIRRIGLPVF